MFDDQIPKSAHDTSVTPRVRDTAPLPQHGYSNTVITEERRGIAPSVVVALILATVAIAIGIAVLVSEHRQDEFQAAAMQPSPTLPPLQPAPTLLPLQISLPLQPALPPAALTTSPMPNLPLPASTVNPALMVKLSSPPNVVMTPNIIDDRKLEEQVQQKLLTTPELAGAPITAKVSAGQVTLSGEVQHPSMKALAEELVKQIKGVTKIINEITVV